ncbi:MAG TPA: phosphoesterase [Candidatus Paceibacterota bacterium]|nr:phosphoesterase [Candidatus Paceibacterota bacterium]
MKTICIYHKDCTDGTAAAAIVLRKHPDAVLYPLGHGYDPRELEPILASVEKGDRILTVDCAIGAREFLAAGHAVTTIDHHVGAQGEYAKLAAENPAYTFIFDEKHSGAGLTWITLFPDEPMPELVKLVEDQDIWNWRYSPDTDNVTNRLWMLDNRPDEVLRLMFQPLDGLKKEGRAITEYKQALIQRAMAKAEPTQVMVGAFKVPFYNLTDFKSELGNLLCAKHGGTVALYTVEALHMRVSFRSLEAHTPSALDIAKLVGGNGHRNAAGAKMELDKFYGNIVR